MTGRSLLNRCQRLPVHLCSRDPYGRHQLNIKQGYKQERARRVLMLCPGTAGVSCSSSLRLWLQGSLQPRSHRLDGKYTSLILCHPCSSARLRVLWEGGREARVPCQPWREQARGNEFSVKGSSKAGASNGESRPVCKRLPKGFENNPLHHGRRRSGQERHGIATERLPPARARSQHRRRHSALLEPGPGYKGLATRALIHDASVNTFIFLELHQGLEAEKTVTPNQNLARWPRL